MKGPGVNILQNVRDLSPNRITNISLISHLAETCIMGKEDISFKMTKLCPKTSKSRKAFPKEIFGNNEKYSPLGTSGSENRKGNVQRDVQGNITYIETHAYRIVRWSSHQDKGSGIMEWVLVKWPKEPVSQDPLETGFKSVLRH